MDWIEASRVDLLAFTESLFLLAKGSRFRVNPHHRIITHTLQRVFLGRTRRLIINIPPRYSKTELMGHFIAWGLGHFPDSEYILASYSKRLAANTAFNIRALVQSPAYRLVFPKVRIRQDSQARDEWRTTRGGIVYATGTAGTITGYGAGKLRGNFGGALIIDDPMKASEAESPTIRQNVIDWYQSTVESRLNSPETPVILIMQRLHGEDLAGWLLEGGNGETWEQLCLPALDDREQPLWPEKHSLADLQRMERANPYVFAAQYLQSPVPKSGGLFKSPWLMRYDAPPDKARTLRVVQSWDTAYKPGQINDPSVCTTWAETKTGYHLLHVWRDRVEYPALKARVAALAAEWRPSAILIEDKASGQSLIQEYRQSTPLPVIPIQPTADKITRASEVSALFESGRVFLPRQAPWLADYEAELALFPKGKHDDQVDSTSQALRWMRDSAAGFAWDSTGPRAGFEALREMAGY